MSALRVDREADAIVGGRWLGIVIAGANNGAPDAAHGFFLDDQAEIAARRLQVVELRARARFIRESVSFTLRLVIPGPKS